MSKALCFRVRPGKGRGYSYPMGDCWRGMAHTLHMRIWRMSLYLYRYIPVSWPTWEKVYCRPSANWKESTLPSRNCTSKRFSATECPFTQTQNSLHLADVEVSLEAASQPI